MNREVDYSHTICKTADMKINLAKMLMNIKSPADMKSPMDIKSPADMAVKHMRSPMDIKSPADVDVNMVPPFDIKSAANMK